ncbi:HNH endonuclease [Bacillus sp. FJAT-44742]|uniref:HNH endonuclease n=1 Tax=Bacillus sp. FJAT-44742 TaxID=2014005 RepID=UPI000C23B53D|nr:hypothetical protein [Bacillus sp. FJAT-44742]
MGWFLVPAGQGSDKVAKGNLKETIKKKYPIHKHHRLISSSDPFVLSELKDAGLDKEVQMWGAKTGPNNERTWKKMKAGDKVILYNSGKYAYLAVVLTKIQSKDLAEKAWPPAKAGGPIFEFIYFLIDVQRIDVSPSDFNPLFGYPGNYSPQSFNSISKDRIKRAASKYGTVEKAIDSVLTGKKVRTRSFTKVEAKSEEEYQSEIESTPSIGITKPSDTPKFPVKRTGATSSGKWYRDPKTALSAIIKADYKCEIDPTHTTFKSKVTGENYVEAHHLILISCQDSFDYSLDVAANVVSLCPNCHRALHHATLKDKTNLLKLLYKKRESRIEKCNIQISEDDLIMLYS